MLTREPIDSGANGVEIADQAIVAQEPPRGAGRGISPPTGQPAGGWRGGNDACAFVYVNLSAYQDGELDPDSLRLVAKHLNHCPACAAAFDTMQETDEMLIREWRDSAPLPSSSRFHSAVDAIMSATPPAPAAPTRFGTKRVHARVRWTRFAAGAAGLAAFASMLWSSYRIGYQQGHMGAALSNAHTLPAGPGARSIPLSSFFAGALAPAGYASLGSHKLATSTSPAVSP